MAKMDPNNPVMTKLVDKGRYKEHPLVIPHIKFEEYAPKFKDLYDLKFEDGILEARWNTDGGPLLWSTQAHRSIWQLCMYVGQDSDVECLILGGTGDKYIGPAYQDLNEEETHPYTTYEHMYYDGCRNIEQLINLEIPTIGVINASGYHTELSMFCDITLMDKDAFMADIHYAGGGMVPGDGVQIAFREAMGIKRATYAMLTSQKITADKALEWGMVNELCPQEDLYKRAWTLAKDLTKTDRRMRRVAVQVLRAPWKKEIAWELRNAFGSEMFITNVACCEHKADDFSNLLKHAEELGV